MKVKDLVRGMNSLMMAAQQHKGKKKDKVDFFFFFLNQWKYILSTDLINLTLNVITHSSSWFIQMILFSSFNLVLL